MAVENGGRISRNSQEKIKLSYSAEDGEKLRKIKNRRNETAGNSDKLSISESGTDKKKGIPTAFKQDKFNSSYEERLKQTPSEKNKVVEFKNKDKRGESLCTLKPPPDKKLKEIFEEADINGIEYKNAVPDFSVVSKIELSGIDMTHGRVGAKGTYSQANNRLAEMLNDKPELAKEFGIYPKNGTKYVASDISKYMSENKLTWHELNDLSTVQMVPTKVNSTFGHLGGISEANKK